MGTHLFGSPCRNVIFVCGLNTYSVPLSVSERYDSEFKQLGVAIEKAKKQSHYLPLAERSTLCGGL